MENPIKMVDLGGPLFLETPIFFWDATGPSAKGFESDEVLEWDAHIMASPSSTKGISGVDVESTTLLPSLNDAASGQQFRA